MFLRHRLQIDRLSNQFFFSQLHTPTPHMPVLVLFPERQRHAIPISWHHSKQNMYRPTLGVSSSSMPDT